MSIFARGDQKGLAYALKVELQSFVSYWTWVLNANQFLKNQ